MNTHCVLYAVLGYLLCCGGCREPQREIVVYCALDREFAEPVLQAYEREQKIRILANYDLESTKTVGLANKILQEQARPRCDLFWNNEILHTLRLKKQDLLQPFHPTGAAIIPPAFRDAEGYWYGFAARARVLLVNTELVVEADRPQSVEDLLDSRWQGKVGLAKPLFGTTATHAAVLFATRGDVAAREFFEKFRANGVILSGNKQVAQAVSSGQLAFGLTDTDDAILEIEAGYPVAIVFPDQAGDHPGTLLIPNTLCLLQGSPQLAEAKLLANQLLSTATEAALARAASAQIPIMADSNVQSRVLPVVTPRWMEVDFPAAAAKWETTVSVLTELFE